MIKRRFFCLSLLPILVGITFILLSVRPVMAEGVVSYDSSKFKPISMIENLPLFNVVDQRPSKQVLFNIKRNVIPVDEYFRGGLQDTIAQSSSVIKDDGRELQFVIKDFRVVFEKFTGHAQRLGGELTSTIEVDVLISDKGTPIEIGIYKTIYRIDARRDYTGSPIDTSYIQKVIDNNFHQILEKIFSDQSFVDAVKKMPKI